MNARPTPEAIPIVGRGTDPGATSGPMSWDKATSRMARAEWFWLTTVRADKRPHVMPILAVWSDGALYFCSKDSAQKSRNLTANDHCVITTDAGDAHLIVEGLGRRVAERDVLERVSDVFRKIYDWSTRVEGDRLDADEGAPTSGGPPYDLFEVRPTKAFALPAGGGTFAPTRWRF